jgi:peptidoglycan-associated lipoprotein
MKKSLLWTLILSCSGLLVLDSCKKQNNDVWDDSNNMGTYRRAKEKILWGGSDSNELATDVESKSSILSSSFDDDFIPLQDEDLKQSFAEAVFAQPKESPGEAGSSIPGIEGFNLPLGALAQVFQTVYFNTDEFTLKKPEHIQVINRISSYLKSHPRTCIFVEGFCDQRGPEAYNLALGSRRANSVRNLLIEQGVSGEQIYTISYGKERLADMGNTPEAWARNRRAEFKIHERR